MTCSMPQRNVHRPGFEPGTPWSDIRRPNHCATPPPVFTCTRAVIYNKMAENKHYMRNYEGDPRSYANPSVISFTFGITKNGLHVYNDILSILGDLITFLINHMVTPVA